MRILMFNRKDIFTHLGGDTVQTIKTAEALRELGIHVTIAVDPDTDTTGYDLIHLFNITRVKATYRALSLFKTKSLPIILSPIYWNMDEFEKKAVKFEIKPRNMKIGKKIEYFIRTKIIRRILPDSREKNITKLRKKVVQSVDLILPNSKMEEELIFRDFGQVDSVVVPNAVDESFFDDVDAEAVNKALGLSPGYILCAARFDERKNQLALIEALKKSSRTLVLAGISPPGERTEYEKICVRAASENVHFLEKCEPKKLAALYMFAHVHVLPSWYETPGLSSIEAALADCNIVVSDKGSTREYFNDMAWYCDPEDSISIRSAIDKACDAPRGNERLKQHILTHFTWKKTAEITRDAYFKVLNRNP